MTRARLIDRLAAALDHAPPPAISPGDLDEPPAIGGPSAKAAAVLVAITDRPVPGLILIRRTDSMRLHGGQVAFPGGRIDPGESVIAAALREAWEELALPPSQVQVIGTADRYRTITGYLVTPVLGVVPPGLTLVANPDEVADWFEVPLDHLLDPANHRRQRTMIKGREREYWQIEWHDRQIWGATAAMLINLSHRMAVRA